MDQKISYEHKIYKSACSYFKAADILREEKIKFPLLLFPYITCATLSLELYIKYLLAIEGKFHKGHSISALYKELSYSTRLELENSYKSVINNQSMRESNEEHLQEVTDRLSKDNPSFNRERFLNKHSKKLSKALTLEESFITLDEAFREWRYIYEVRERDTKIINLNSLENAISAVILMIKNKQQK